MGTKRALAPMVRDIVEDLSDGPLLDAFAGMGAVAQALSTARPVWLNDIQNYAATFARARFQSAGPTLSLHDAIDILSPDYNANYRSLVRQFQTELHLEDEMIASDRATRVAKWRLQRAATHAAPDARAVLTRFRHATPRIRQLFTRSYSHGYFTLRQSAEIDSIRAAIDRAVAKRAIAAKDRDWLLLALSHSVRKAAFTTGHFAQYLTLAPRTLKRFQKVASRRVWDSFLEEIEGLPALAIRATGHNNNVYRSDATQLLRRLRNAKVRPGIVYADPPYTADHYSRYYHVWESLILYDYPSLTGKGRYRPDRFQTPYSIKAEVKGALNGFIAAARALDSTLVLSYPANGLLHEAGCSPYALLKNSYSKVERFSMRHQHSTMGASDGLAKSPVTEHIYVATV